MIRLLALMAFAGVGLAQPPLIPLLWTQGQPPETIRQAVREVADGGNTGFVWESRPHPDYLGPQWWSDLRVAVDEARRLKLEVWIFDERMYPSGIAGGKVVAQHPEFALHTLEERTVAVQGPVAEKDWEIPAPLAAKEQVVSVVAFPERFRSGQAPVTLPGAARVRWAAPDGRWRICWSVSRAREPRPGWSMANMIDVMNPGATAEFIRLTHEATYAHFRGDFGKTIKGFFSDESGFRNVDSYASLPGKPGAPMPWSPTFAAYFQKLKGYDIAAWLPALWYDFGPRGRIVRFDFVDACSRAFAENFFKPQQEWCHAHGVRLIGHLVEDNHADHNLGYGPGNWFRAEHFFDIPGIDVVGYQVTPGMDSGAMPWRVPDSQPWDEEFFAFGLPAMARGAALLKGSPEIFSEAFGAYGWAQGLRMTKWISDWHIVNGISVLSPHAYTMKYDDPDCPQHFNRMSGNPQWRYYREWTREFRPLQQLIAGSDPVYETAVLYTGESAWVGAAQEPSQAVRALETSQVSTVIVPYDAIDGLKNRVPAIVLPYVQFVPADAIERLAGFAEAGGTVIVLEAWPQEAVDSRDGQRVSAAIGRLKASRAVLTTLWDLPARFPSKRVEAVPAMGSVVTAWRKAKDAEWLILHNRSLSGTASGRVALAGAPRHAALYDPASGGYRAVNHRVADGRLVIDVDLPPYALWCLRLSDELPPVRKVPVYPVAQTPALTWQVSRAADDAASRFESIGRKTELEDWRRWPEMESYAGTVRYRTTLELAAAPGDAIALDAGRVEEIAELTVNGKQLGARIYPPYRWDISGVVRNGENEIVLDVTNTAFARWKDSFSHGDAVSGLLGPVHLLREK
ncbi:MAG TPA: hypothetical protein VE959_34390 [Bryobacteraceae bacterium]|nr:hypothetical protein [Bryobacteraceae bacterium]